ncbi:hypothetical protein C0989_007845 [Termitomyces sp. Mn162]|nr:hypothetical protein C0989_007845 [Termitomyces sp. Mn162]
MPYQYCDEVLHFLCLSPVEFTRRAHTLLVILGYSNTSTASEVWADQLLNFHKCYLQGNLPKTMQGTLGIDANLQNKLCTLVEEIHTSLNPHPFKDPLDPFRSFHVQCEEPVGTQIKALPPIPCQQEELNAASSILRNLNPVGELFDQPAAHTLALSACPWANSVPSTFCTWDQPATSKSCAQQPPPHVDDNNWTLSYIDKSGNPTNKPASCNSPPQDRSPQFDLHAPHVNVPPLCQNIPIPPRQPTGSRAPRPPFSSNSPCPPPVPMPNPPTDAIYFVPPNSGGPPPS